MNKEELQQKRMDFENAEWLINFSDWLPYNPLADPHCICCNGFGVIDVSTDSGLENTNVIFDNCPECWV